MVTLTPDRKKLRNLLCDTLLSLCKNGLDYDNNLRIEALIGITVDNSDVFLISLQDTIAVNNVGKNPGDVAASANNNIAVKVEPSDQARNEVISAIKSSTIAEFESIVNVSDERVTHIEDKEINQIDDALDNNLKIETIESDSEDEDSKICEMLKTNLKQKSNSNITDCQLFFPITPSTSSNNFYSNKHKKYDLDENNILQFQNTSDLCFEQKNSHFKLIDSDQSMNLEDTRTLSDYITDASPSLASINMNDFTLAKSCNFYKSKYKTKKRKTRSIFTNSQLQRLEEVFAQNKYVDMELKKSLSEELGLALYVINVWFQNRRNRYKRSLFT